MMRYSLSQYEHRGEDWKIFRIAALLCVVAFLSMSIVEQAWSARLLLSNIVHFVRDFHLSFCYCKINQVSIGGQI